MSDAPPLPRNLATNPILARWIGFEHAGRVRVTCGKVEIGQGILTALTQIAADELDVEPARIDMHAADTALSPNEEVTSGSLSVQESGMALRHAAAEVRAAFRAAAATVLDSPEDELRIVDGAFCGDGNHAVSYWELAGRVDLERPATGLASPKPAGARRVTGISHERIDIPGRVFGSRPYLHDLVPEGLVHGRVIRSARPGAHIAAIDEDGFAAAFPAVTLVRDGDFLGLVATSEPEARRAAADLSRRVTWSGGETLPDRHDLAGWLLAAPATTLPVAERGAPEPVRPLPFQRLYSRPFLAHASIGPSVAIAAWQGDHLDVTSHSQGIFNLQRDLALVFGLPLEHIRVRHAEGAGCYGHNGADDVALDAALLARAAGAPVRVLWSRADELMQSPFGAGMAMRLDADLDATGGIAHWRHEVFSNGHVARPGRNPVPALLAARALAEPFPPLSAGDPPLASGGGAQRNAVPIYDIPNLTVLMHRITEQPLRTSSLRSLGAFGNVFAIESFMDELALATNQDPLAFRLRHLSDPRARAVLEAAAVMGGWNSVRAEATGRGLGFARYKNTGAYCAVLAEVDVERDLRVTSLAIAADLGEVVNPDGAINQIEGGAIQATSFALKEAVAFSREALESGSWEAYPILRFSEVPAVRVELIARPDAPPLGAGECAHGPVAAAIANAVFDALGARVRHLPITRETIISALEDE